MPWAEPVLMTAEELPLAPEDRWNFVLVDGRLVRTSPTGEEHGLIVMALLRAVDRLVQHHDLGRVYPAQTGFWISPEGEPDTVLAPDVAVVRSARSRPPERGYPRLAPDLIAEVASPSQSRGELAVKAQRWLRAGVRLVWVVLPDTRTVEVWPHGSPPRTLTADDELSGEDVLPGFALPVSALFP